MSAYYNADYWTYSNQRLITLRTYRYSWWTHWRELADMFLPRRYRWLITPNLQNRGSPINGHIIDSTGVVAARNLAAGLMSGKTSPTRPWYKLKIDGVDSRGTNPISIWLKDCEEILARIFQKSNFYNAIAQWYYDLVVFGTAALLIYEDYEKVINCYNPCAGEYYVALDGSYRPKVFYREFTMSIAAVVERFGIENVSDDVRKTFEEGKSIDQEIIVAHSMEPNNDDRGFVDKRFAFRECYWQFGGSSGQQNGSQANAGRFLEIKGYYEQCAIPVRWDLTGNDAYGRSPCMDGLGDQKQLQQETKRKGQAIDKGVNPPLVADIALKNQPASQLPGALTYATFGQNGKPNIGSIYDKPFPVADITNDLIEVRMRLEKTLFNDLFRPLSQYETRSNITIPEIDQRKAEALIMLGPVFTRVDTEGLSNIIDRVWGIASRAGLLPPPPPEIAGRDIDVEFESMLAIAQNAAAASGIERVLGVAGNMAAVNPRVILKIDEKFTLDKFNELLGNDPRIMRSNEEVAEMEQAQAQQEQAAAQAEQVDLYAKGAKTLSETSVGGSKNALQMMTGL